MRASLIFAAIILAVPSCVPGIGAAQEPTTTMPPAASGPASVAYVFVPSEAKVITGFGAGLGVPYGVIGGRFFVGNDRFSLDAGLGMMPFAWEAGYSIGGSFYTAGRAATFRPRVTAAFSNVVAAVVITKSGSTDAEYSKLYGGFAVYAGGDWRMGKASGLSLDLNLGAVFPTDGIDKVKSDWKRVKEYYEWQGYELSQLSEPRTAPFVSLGLVYCPARALRQVRTGQ